MVNLLWGPPFAAKSQIIELAMQPEDVVVDLTMLWRALYPGTQQRARPDEVALYLDAVRVAAVRAAAEHEVTAWVPISTPDRSVVRLWMADAGADKVTVVQPPLANVLAAARRRARRDGTDACEQIVRKWFDSYAPAPEDVPFSLEEWDIDPGSRLGKYLTQGGSTMPMAEARSAVSSDGCRRVNLAAGLEIRAARKAGGRPVLAGTVLRYGDRSRLGLRMEEVFRPGAIEWDHDAPMNLTRQHDRGQPVGLVRLADGPDELRFEAEIVDTQAGRDTVTEVQAGLMRGASLEFHAVREEWETRKEMETRIVTKAFMSGLSVVDDGAFRSGRVEARASVLAARDRWRDEAAARRTLEALAELEASEALRRLGAAA